LYCPSGQQQAGQQGEKRAQPRQRAGEGGLGQGGKDGGEWVHGVSAVA